MRARLSCTVLLLAPAATSSLACEWLVSASDYQCATDGDCQARGAAFAGTVCASRTCVAAQASGGASSPDASVPDASPTDASSMDASSMDASSMDASPSATDSGDAAETGLGAAVDSKWGCLGNVTWPAENPAVPVQFSARFVHLTDESPVVGMTVEVCGRFDYGCSPPMSTAQTDDDGAVSLALYEGFRGFLILQPPPSFPDMIPALMDVFPPPSKDVLPDAAIVRATERHLASTSEIDAILGVIGRSLPPPDSGLGHVFALAVDCTGAPAAGVSVRVTTPTSDQTIAYYTDQTGMLSTTAQVTSPIGECGYIDLPAGGVTVDTSLADGGARVGEEALITRDGFITYLLLPPSP